MAQYIEHEFLSFKPIKQRQTLSISHQDPQQTFLEQLRIIQTICFAAIPVDRKITDDVEIEEL